MANSCEICGKRTIFGHSISHSHKLSNRRWKPNIQRVKVDLHGQTMRMKVCTKCIRSGRVKKAV